MESGRKLRRQDTGDSMSSEEPERIIPGLMSTSDLYENNIVNDITVEWVYNPHTLTALIAVFCVMMFGAFTGSSEFKTSEENLHTALPVVIFVFLMLSLLAFPSGPFIRPHPAFWRLVFGCSVMYLIALVLLLFQNVTDARRLLTFFDPSLNKPLEQRSYGEECTLTVSSFLNSIDVFVLCHFFGWMFKAIMLRDWVMLWILSAGWEIIEMCFTYALPNFAECWWDHWILDFLICNGLGIEVGIYICNYMEVKTYSWSGIFSIPSISGKAKRLLLQFTPEDWMAVRWQPLHSIKRFLAVHLLIFCLFLGELNAFFLKSILWLPVSHPLNQVRLYIIIFIGLASLRQFYVFLVDPECKRMGTQTWVACAILWTELLIIIKFGKGLFPPMPENIFNNIVYCGIIYLFFMTFLMLRMKRKKRKRN